MDPALQHSSVSSVCLIPSEVLLWDGSCSWISINEEHVCSRGPVQPPELQHCPLLDTAIPRHKEDISGSERGRNFLQSLISSLSALTCSALHFQGIPAPCWLHWECVCTSSSFHECSGLGKLNQHSLSTSEQFWALQALPCMVRSSKRDNPTHTSFGEGP